MSMEMATSVADAYVIGNTGDITGVTNNLQVDIIGKFKSFSAELSSMLREYAEEGSPLHIEGVEYDAKTKQTAGVQLLLDNRLQEIQNVQSTLLNIVNILFQLDKSAGQIGSGG